MHRMALPIPSWVCGKKRLQASFIQASSKDANDEASLMHQWMMKKKSRDKRADSPEARKKLKMFCG